VSHDGSNSNMSQSFNDPLLQDFMTNFYGNFRGAYWFIGMEEGGGACRPAGTSRRKTLHCLRG